MRGVVVVENQGVATYLCLPVLFHLFHPHDSGDPLLVNAQLGRDGLDALPLHHDLVPDHFARILGQYGLTDERRVGRKWPQLATSVVCKVVWLARSVGLEFLASILEPFLHALLQDRGIPPLAICAGGEGPAR